MWYYVYILELSNNKHYVGCTVNLKERYSRHKKEYLFNGHVTYLNYSARFHLDDTPIIGEFELGMVISDSIRVFASPLL